MNTPANQAPGSTAGPSPTPIADAPSGPNAGSTVRSHDGSGAWLTEDWTAVVVGFAVFLCALAAAWWVAPAAYQAGAEAVESGVKWSHPWKPWLGSVGRWDQDPRQGLLHDGFEPKAGEVAAVSPKSIWPGWVGMAVVLAGLGAAISWLRGRAIGPFLLAFPALFGLALLANVMAKQQQVEALGLEYVLWALLLGLLISNTIGTPLWLRPAVLGELFVKLGLVLLGAEVLLGTLLKYGIPGIFVAWVVTPVVLVTTYWFGQTVLRMQSKTLNIVISADMSVCGVSAAIATAAACRAKKDELSMAIGLSMGFTVVMMVLLPKLCLAIGLPEPIAGAWIGGTIDSTGAVAAAGELVGAQAGEVAVTIKMIQNTLIGVVAFAVATYWVSVVERPSPSGSSAGGATAGGATAGSDGTAEGLAGAPSVAPSQRGRVGIGEIWRRFPKFVLGFVGVSLLASAIAGLGAYEALGLDSVQSGVTKPLRGWLFCLAFVCIGLESNVRQFLPHLRSGKPLALYVVGQSLNLLLTLAMAYLMFGWLFADMFAAPPEKTP